MTRCCLYMTGARLHATAPGRPDLPAQIQLVRHHAPLRRPSLHARPQLPPLQPPPAPHRPAPWQRRKRWCLQHQRWVIE